MTPPALERRTFSVSRADHERLAARMRELAELAGLMEERGYLPPAPEPMPLHRAVDGPCATSTIPSSPRCLPTPGSARPSTTSPARQATAMPIGTSSPLSAQNQCPPAPVGQSRLVPSLPELAYLRATPRR